MNLNNFIQLRFLDVRFETHKILQAKFFVYKKNQCIAIFRSFSISVTKVVRFIKEGRDRKYYKENKQNF